MSATVQAIVVGGAMHGETYELEDFRWMVRAYEYRPYPEDPIIRNLELRRYLFGPWLHNILVEDKDVHDDELIRDALMARLHKETGLGQRIESEAA